MPHQTSNQPWGKVDLDLSTGRVFVQEDWYYQWRLWPGVTSAWTYEEKRRTHARTDQSIWKVWSNRLFLNAKATSGAPRFGSKVPINFDVRWVLHPPGNWTVIV